MGIPAGGVACVIKSQMYADLRRDGTRHLEWKDNDEVVSSQASFIARVLSLAETAPPQTRLHVSKGPFPHVISYGAPATVSTPQGTVLSTWPQATLVAAQQEVQIFVYLLRAIAQSRRHRCPRRPVLQDRATSPCLQ